MQMRVISTGESLLARDEGARASFERSDTIFSPMCSRGAQSMADDVALDAEMSNRMKRMVGFRNIAAHDYTQLNLDVVQGIVTHHLDEFLNFS